MREDSEVNGDVVKALLVAFQSRTPSQSMRIPALDYVSQLP